MRSLTRNALLLLVMATPVVSVAAARNFSELAEILIYFLNAASGVVIGACIAVYFWAVAKDFKKIMSGETQRSQELLVWGVIGIFVMVSVWGILRLIENSIFGM